MTRFGLVQSFDGYDQVPRTEQRSILAKTTGLERIDNCNFEARVMMTADVRDP